MVRGESPRQGRCPLRMKQPGAQGEASLREQGDEVISKRLVDSRCPIHKVVMIEERRGTEKEAEYHYFCPICTGRKPTTPWPPQEAKRNETEVVQREPEKI